MTEFSAFFQSSHTSVIKQIICYTIKVKKKFLVVLLVIVLLRVSVWTLPFVRDAYGYAFIGKEVAHGAIPYLQIWDHKPPGVYWLNGLIYILSPSYIIGLRIAEIFFSVLSSFLFYKLMKCFFSDRTTFISTLLFSIFSNVYILTQGDNMVETYMVSILVALYYLLVKAIQTKRISLFFLSGISLGMLFIFKQVGILPLGGIVVFLYFQEEQAFQKIRALILGVCVSILPVIGYFMFKNALYESFEAIFLYNFLYAGQGYSFSSIAQSLYYLYQVISGTLLLWFLGIIGTVNKPRNRIDTLFIILFVTSFLGSAMGGEFAFSRNYLLLIIPSVGYFAALGIEEINRTVKENNAFKKAIIAGVFFLLVPSVVLQCQAIFAGLYFRGLFNPGGRQVMYTINLTNYNFIQDERQYFNIISYLKSRVSGGDYILDFGAEPEIYLLTGTHAPTRFFYNFPINGVFIHDERQMARKKIFMEEIKRNEPAYIITNKNEERHKPSFINLNFPEFVDYVHKKYYLEKEIDNYLIFKHT